MPMLWFIDIEAHEQRYTVEWKKYLPIQLSDAMFDHSPSSRTVEVIDGGESSGTTTLGAFVDFADSSRYKAHQVRKIAQAFHAGLIGDGHRFLFADAWHPGVIQCRYMAGLLGIEITIDVMWHAGSYDPWDILGQKIQNKAWSYGFERAVFDAADVNYFATQYHRDLFIDKLAPTDPECAEVVGWPMEYLTRKLGARAHGIKKDTILFPHRLSPEKQPEIMQLLEPHFGDYRVVYAQKEKLTKEEYHNELARSVAVFSANQQETLGIAMYEGLLCGAVPIMPNRLSYKEIYVERCYPSEWTESFEAAEANVENLVGFIRTAIANETPDSLEEMGRWAGADYFDGRELYACVYR